VLRGRGFSAANGELVAWGDGDFITLPACSRSTHHAATDAAMYCVTDELFVRFLGATAIEARIAPTNCDGQIALAELEKVALDPHASELSRVSILLVNAIETQTLTVTHTRWAMLGLLPVAAVQRPHRHQSVALDLIVECAPGCYTLVGDTIDADGEIVDAERVDWISRGAFVHAARKVACAPQRSRGGLPTFVRHSFRTTR
jgi:gentisate 1,2-dioxygenase